jgi:hypothetical protein
LSLLALEGFGQHLLSCIKGHLCHPRDWPTQVDIHFVSSLALDGFLEHILIFIFFLRLHGIGLGIKRDIFCFLADMGGVLSTHVEMHFMSLLAREGHAVVHYVSLLAWGGHVEIHFVSLLSWEEFGCIFCTHWQGSVLINTY